LPRSGITPGFYVKISLLPGFLFYAHKKKEKGETLNQENQDFWANLFTIFTILLYSLFYWGVRERRRREKREEKRRNSKKVCPKILVFLVCRVLISIFLKS